MEENQVTPPKFSGFAVTSFVLAITCFGAPLALIFAIIALAQIAKSPHLRGQGLAIAGIAISIIWPMLMFLYFIRPTGTRAPMRTSCLNNLMQIGTAINMYESDWGDKYPLVSGPGREFERIWPDINKPFPANLRTKSSGGERRWFPNLIAPYARNRKILMCPAVSERGTWKTPDGTISYYKNRHGGWTTAEGDPHGMNSRQPVRPPEGSPRPDLVNDPPTTYYFNAVTTKDGHVLLISGESESVCEHTADAPLVWDTPCGYGDGYGNSSFAHRDSMNVLYADGHVKNFWIPDPSTGGWLTSQFWLLHSSEGWFADQ